MLSIAPIGNASYYLGLAREDYFLSGGEPPGIWLGSGVTDVLEAVLVRSDDLQCLLAGFSPDGRPLIQNAGNSRHQMGWDLTFSAPKSVSIVWAISSAKLRQKIQAAQFRAIQAAVFYLEQAASFSRRSKGGECRDPAGLLVAAFEHGTSRAQDPQLHTHCLVLNVAKRPDGTFGTIESLPLYRHKMAAGAVYRAELASELQELGFTVERAGSLFEIAGVPQALAKHFSKRRAAIEESLESFGVESARAAEVAAKATRDSKTELPRSELLAHWQEEAARFGFYEHSVERLQEWRADKRSIGELIHAAIYGTKNESQNKPRLGLAEERSYFSEKDLVRSVSELAPGSRLSAQEIIHGVKDYLASSTEVVRLGYEQQEQQFTTAALFQTEANLLETARTLASHSTHRVSDDALADVFNRRPTLSDEQQSAVRALTQGSDLALVNGLPGTGKTTMLAACRESWERAGYQVIGCTVSAKAARELAQGSGIASYTIAKILDRWSESLGETLTHHAKQLVRAARGKRTRRPERTHLDANTILVVDEAGMADTRQLQALQTFVSAEGAKLVLVGDTRQLPAIGPGGAFEALCQEHGAAELGDMKRQRNRRDLEALQALAAGDARTAIESFELRQMLTLAETKADAVEQLIRDWKPVGLVNPQSTSIITTTNREAAIINRRCQEERLKSQGRLGLVGLTVGEQHFTEGDRVLFLENNRFLGVLNGDLGTVTGVDLLNRKLSILLDASPGDKARIVSIPIGEYKQLSLGYARTTHKEQGATVEHAFVLLGGAMQDKEISFVQASRHREQVRFYADRYEAGPDLQGLVEQMTRSGAKRLAHSVSLERSRVNEYVPERKLTYVEPSRPIERTL